MKTVLRILGVLALGIAALMVVAVLYLAFGDLGRHKGFVESVASKQLGRPVKIEGRFALDVFPAIGVDAERISIGNAGWSQTPRMLEVGSFSTRIDLGSIFNGPVNVRSLELHDVEILLERDADGTGNWSTGSGEKRQAAQKQRDGALAKLPVAFQQASVTNLTLTVRAPATPDQVARIDSFTIRSGEDGLLAIDGRGSLDDHPARLTGEAGPLASLISGRNIRLDLDGGLGKLVLGASGSIGRLHPFDGADLSVSVQSPDLEGFLKKLRLPVIATGTLELDARLKDTGKRSDLVVDAKLGDITARVEGTLATLGLRDSDLKLDVHAADAGRLAAVFDVGNVPAQPIDVSGRLLPTRESLKFQDVKAKLGGVEATLAGSIPARGGGGSTMQFEVRAADLSQIRTNLPALPLQASGELSRLPDQVEVSKLDVRIGESRLQGSVKLRGGSGKRLEADFSSPLLDLTALLPGEPGTAADSTAQQEAKPRGQYVFAEEPLPLERLHGSQVKVHLKADGMRIARGQLHDVEAAVTNEGGRLQAAFSARGGYGGSIGATVNLVASAEHTADLDLDLHLQDVRSGLSSGEGVRPEEVPPLSLKLQLKAHGSSPRQLASSADGSLLLTQGKGKSKSSIINLVGSDILAQLLGRLNPFAEKDPYTQVDCMVARAVILDGKAKVSPVLLQSEKVSITASGHIDLATEKLTLNFTTRPRQGIGISPGMFTNPFIDLTGTLAHPTIGIGGKGVTSGALAAATGGISVVAKGVVDRVIGETDQCRSALEEAQRPPAEEEAGR